MMTCTSVNPVVAVSALILSVVMVGSLKFFCWVVGIYFTAYPALLRFTTMLRVMRSRSLVATVIILVAIERVIMIVLRLPLVLTVIVAFILFLLACYRTMNTVYSISLYVSSVLIINFTNPHLLGGGKYKSNHDNT